MEAVIYVLIEDGVDMINILSKAGYTDIGTGADYSRPYSHMAIIIRGE